MSAHARRPRFGNTPSGHLFGAEEVVSGGDDSCERGPQRHMLAGSYLVFPVLPPRHTCVGLIRSPSVDSLLADLSAGLCDVAVLPVEQPELEPVFVAACAIHPAASVWVTGGRVAGFRLYVSSGVVSGGGGHPAAAWPGRGLFLPSLEAVRLTWLRAWADWVAAAALQGSDGGTAGALPARCFLRALVALSTAEGESEPRGQRHLWRRLAGLGLRGPKRFWMAARVFCAWELARLARWSLEHIAYRLGFASLWSMDRSFLAFGGLPPREVARLGDRELASHLAAGLRRPGREQKVAS